MNIEPVGKNTRLERDGRALLIDLPYEHFMARYQDWENGVLIQNAFPMLTPTEREFILTGMTDEEWDEATLFEPPAGMTHDEWEELNHYE